MAFLHCELRKTIKGKKAYASNRSFLEFVNDSLRDIGIYTSENLPSYTDKNKETTVRELLKVQDHLYEMKDLAYSVCAHESILDRAKTGEVDLPLEELSFHQTYANDNKSRVQEYYSATQTLVEIIEEKIAFLDGLHSQLSPTPWRLDQTPCPAFYPLITGVITHLETEKNWILSESVVLDEDISGFDDNYFQEFIKNMASTPSWSKPNFRDQWACNIPPFDAPPNADFLNRPSQVSSVISL